MKTFQVEFEYRGKVWITEVEAWDRDNAMEQFRRDNPHCKLRACDEEIMVSVSDHTDQHP